MGKMRKIKKFLTQPVRLFAGRKADPEELYRAQAVLQEKAVKSLDNDAKRAEKRFREYFQKWINTNVKSDEACLQSIDNYVKSGTFEDLEHAYVILSQRLTSGDIKADAQRYRFYAEKLIDFLGSEEVGLYGRAASMAFAMAEREEELGRKEEKDCNCGAKRYKLLSQKFKKIGDEMQKKSTEKSKKTKTLDDSVEEFTQQEFARWM